jgi:hypothetical protein
MVTSKINETVAVRWRERELRLPAISDGHLSAA